MELIVKKQFKQFEGILDVGDKVQLELTYYKKDTVILNESGTHLHYYKNNKTPFLATLYPKFDKVIAKKGSLDGGYRIHAKNGKVYDEGCVLNMIGYKSLGDIFEELN